MSKGLNSMSQSVRVQYTIDFGILETSIKKGSSIQVYI